MKKWIIKTAAIMTAAIVFVTAVTGITLATFNPNDHKDRIASIVKEKTGRDLVIAGNIGVSLFPVLGFEAHGVQLGNPSRVNNASGVKKNCASGIAAEFHAIGGIADVARDDLNPTGKSAQFSFILAGQEQGPDAQIP